MIRIGVTLLVLLSVIGIPTTTVQASISSISAVPSLQVVSPGSNFDVFIQISTDTQSRSANCALNWDPDKVECISVEQGGFYRDFAATVNASVIVQPSDPPPVDNIAGRLPSSSAAQNAGVAMNVGDFVTPGSSIRKGVTGSGNLFILHMKAKEGASGETAFTISNERVNNNNSIKLNATVINGQINISSSTQDPPAINSFSPSSAGTGMDVTIEGSHLSGATVKFGTTLAGAIKSNTDTQIVVAVGSGSSGKINVTTLGGSVDSGSDFTFIPAPTIASFTPTSAGPGMNVVITGTNLSGATAVSFGSSAAQSFTVDSSTQITAVIAGGSTGKVSIITPGGTRESGGNFTFIPAPTISDFNPRTAGKGMDVTIDGTNFTQVREIRFGGVTAEYKSSSGSTQIVATVGDGASGAVTVITAGGTVESGNVFTFDSTTPIINDFSPRISGVGHSVVISGANFTSDCIVKFGGVNAQSMILNSSAQITAVVGSGATGIISVTNSKGTISRSGFIFAPTPAIDSFSPVTANTGDTITITGSDFIGESIEVKFGGTSAQSVTVDSESQISAVVGNGTSGNVSVTTVGGTATKSGFSFTGPTSSPTSTPSSTPTVSPTVSSTPAAASSTPSPTPNQSSSTAPRPGRTTSPAGGIPQPVKTTRKSNSTASQVISSQNSKTGKNLDLNDVIDSGGIIQEDMQYQDIRVGSQNRIALIEIRKGTRVLTADGQPVEMISVVNAGPTAPPQNSSIIDAFEFEPSGATFSLPLGITLEYDPSLIPAGLDAGDLQLACYDVQNGKWVNCDYVLDTSKHRLTAQISHFSLYAVIVKNSSGIMSPVNSIGYGWSLAGTIIIVELVIGVLVVYIFLRRRRPVLLPIQAAAQTDNRATTSELPVQTVNQEIPGDKPNNKDSEKIVWDDILQESKNRAAAFKTSVEVIGGKIIIPRDGKASDIELVNMPDSRILIALEYDPEINPKGSAKIIILGTSSEYEKLKERK
jgi:hypothetical protein